MQSLVRLTIAFAVSASLAFAGAYAGRQVRVRIGQTISSEKARSGEHWDGALAAPLTVAGKTVARRGAPVRGRIVEADDSGRLKGRAVLRLRLISINGVAVTSTTFSRVGPAHTKRNTLAIGGGAAVGAAIGAIAGGGKGAAIGAASGAGAGTAGAAATGKKDIVIPVETILTFSLR